MIKLPIDVDRYLKPLIVVLIVLWCGPEVFAVIELTTLLELLGATLFLFAFGVSFKALTLSIFDSVGEVLVPAESRELMKAGAVLGAILVGLRQGLLNAVVLIVLCVAPYAILSDLLR